MEVFFYIIIFIIGSLFGSFYTLAVYRIPKRQDIIHTHSYCPNCNHKLGLLDLFPIFSYIFLGGKCRYCKQKIRPRYLILEALSGCLFVVIAKYTGLGIYTLNATNIINFCFIVLFLTYIVLMAGIDKEYRKIDKAVNIYGITISIIYMAYLCIVGDTSIYRYVIYLFAVLILMLIDIFYLRKKVKDNYPIEVLLLSILMIAFTYELQYAITVTMTLLTIAFVLIFSKIKNRKAKSIKTKKNKDIKRVVGFNLV